MTNNNNDFRTRTILCLRSAIFKSSSGWLASDGSAVAAFVSDRGAVIPVLQRD